MVGAIVLAAGAAARMGVAKQILPFYGKPLIWWPVKAACESKVSEIVVVTGLYQNEVREALHGLPVKFVHNENWSQGQAASLKIGVLSLSHECQAALFILADQPLVTTEFINQLIDTYESGIGSIVVPVCQNRRGNPVIIDLNRWQGDIAALGGDEGARKLITANPQEVIKVPVEDEMLFFDVDSPTDYEFILTKFHA